MMIAVSLAGTACSLLFSPIESDADPILLDSDGPDLDGSADSQTGPDGDSPDAEELEPDAAAIDAELEDAAPDAEDIACHPDCDSRACGPDKCGGVCGACREGENCNELGQCFLVDVDCGDSFEQCCAGSVCNNGTCQAGYCAPCGTRNQLCCLIPPQCAPGLRCQRSFCI